MTAEQYEPIHRWFTEKPARLRALTLLNRWLPRLVAAAYGALLLWLALEAAQTAQPVPFVYSVALPAAAFLLCTVLRGRIDAPRPCTQPGFVPLVAQKRSGQSFPSRHAASAAVLAVIFWRSSPALGLGMAAAALLICLCRVLAGSHFIRDVAAGAALGTAFGAAAFLF